MGSFWKYGLRYAVNISTVSLCFVGFDAHAAPQDKKEVTTDFRLVSNAADNSSFKAILVLENQTNAPLKNWNLHFSFVRPITKVEGAELVKDETRNGDYYTLKGEKGETTLDAGEKLEFEIDGKWFLRHDTDAPAGYFVTVEDENKQRRVVDVADSATIDPNWKPKPGEDDLSREKRYAETSIEGNSLNRKAGNERVIPLPAEYKEGNGPAFVLTAKTPLIVQSKEAAEAAEFLARTIETATGYALTVKEEKQGKLPASGIIFTSSKGKDPESYELTSDAKRIVLKANAENGFHYAVQTLRQLLPAQIFAAKTTTGIEWTVPAVTIKDEPRFSYRGLHLDVARNFVPLEDVKRLIDLMAIHKLNRFHWHLTDDEGWRVEIKKYPQLTEIGAWRGYGLPIAPTLGSGAKRYGGFYTQEEIKDVVAYAKARQITIIPEIDMPGHARAMIKSLPHLLADPADKSRYESVQAYTDNVLNPCLDTTYEVIDNVVAEVATLFPGEYVHVGGDEVPNGVWDPALSPNCKKLMEREGLKDKLAVENHFLKKVKASVEKHGKTMAGWEEVVGGTGFDQKNVLVYAWIPENKGEKVLKGGYDVVLNPANFLYFDLAFSEDPKEPGYYWAGTIDTFKAYSYTPIPKGMSAAEKKNVKGIQGNLWSETIKSRDDLDYRAFPRVAALAEVAWTPAEKRNWKSFSTRLNEQLAPALDQYGVKYRRSQAGTSSASRESKPSTGI